MKTTSIKAVRCAIYTRVSTDNGLDQEFNSLDAQYDAASSYIQSQAHAGWTLIRSRYDDGGYSGGSTDRPDLQRLLDDIRDRKIDVIVVYKVDRLTRSLADFAKLVELFDAHGVSFVSVTQQFNTTTSMGRLTLNVLLSFAQFEREVTSERIRDKIAASKRKGIWVGGPLPLGYAMNDGKIAVVEEEADRVRTIFQRYLELGGVHALMRNLSDQKIFTKSKLLATGQTRGGIPFGRGSLCYLLRNRFYIGEVTYKNEILSGEQPAIVERELFEAVQQKLTSQRSHRTIQRNKSDYLLTGLLYDGSGHRMIPTHATKAGIRYRYYVSSPHLYGQSKIALVGSVSRIAATQVEDAVTNALNEHLIAQNEKPRSDPAQRADRNSILEHVARIDVHTDRLILTLKSQHPDGDDESLTIAWEKPPSRKFKEILLPHNKSRADVRPIRTERRTRLVAAIARGRRWLNEVVSGEIKAVEEIAAREKCSVRQVNMTISLAFLAPALVKAAVEGRLPRGIGVERLRDAPAEWTRQFEALGLNPR
ncbi:MULTISPECIES: recombinase family protein [Nitrobacteraceae]|uniref:DNA invertase Pin-like site-specific DNA recombinase n=1 Tax=Afipia massiliensis TaxID=211460 RepID=A0A840N1W6_9BRAD|nr:DNA invertase Pin-like site-specific DNA recombinase [Afipia massiliensis]MCF2521986.1 recombinase family protein [Bradyrhizobium sp. G127]MDO8979528.1 recombinase family protein [Afipia sp.]